MIRKRDLTNLLARRGFHLLLFVAAALLFSWPILSASDTGPAGLNMLVYVFVVWAAVILAILLVSRHLRDEPAEQPGEDR